MNSTIPRIHTDSLQAERVQLIQEAQAKLGYRSTYGKLLGTLAKLDLIPFRTGAVEAWKKDHEWTSIYSGTKNWLYWEAANIIAISLGTWGWFHSATRPYSIALLIAVAISTLSSLITSADMIGYGERTKWTWATAALSRYQDPIPDHVLAKALSLKKALPEVNLNVVYLESTTDQRNPDPFLQAVLGEEIYYIEQWDEKDLPRLDV